MVVSILMARLRPHFPKKLSVVASVRFLLRKPALMVPGMNSASSLPAKFSASVPVLLWVMKKAITLIFLVVAS